MFKSNRVRPYKGKTIKHSNRIYQKAKYYLRSCTFFTEKNNRFLLIVCQQFIWCEQAPNVADCTKDLLSSEYVFVEFGSFTALDLLQQIVHFQDFPQSNKLSMLPELKTKGAV